MIVTHCVIHDRDTLRHFQDSPYTAAAGLVEPGLDGTDDQSVKSGRAGALGL